MDQSSIETFLTVAEEGSFRKAAGRLGYTQAGVSYIIHTLEEDMGLTLFIRERTGVRLSPEGQELLPYIRQLDSDNRVLEDTIHELQGLERGSLRVQVFDSISIHWLPGILQQFKKEYPCIHVELISEEDSAKAEAMVSMHEVDCGFFLTDVHSELDVFTLLEENLLAIVSPDHELADREYFPVSRLGEFPYISMKYDHHTGIRGIFEKHHTKPNTAYCMDNDYAAMAMVSKGLGYCIFPELLLQDIPYEIRCLRFDKPQKRTIRIGTRSMETASKACVKFIECTRKWVKENTAPVLT
ncbi:MAG: LysR family transcriptional regulator [Clostridiales bacterium]|nr:LysR family transcriptional regulator [Candidatus Blautia equi]